MLYKGIILIVDNDEILTGNLSEGSEAISIWTKTLTFYILEFNT